MRVALRAIAALEVLAALVMAVLTVHGLGILLPGSPGGGLLLALAGATFVAVAAFAGIQLWRLREPGRIATIIFLIVLMLFSAAVLLMRGQPHVIVRLILEGAALAVLLSRRAREACAAGRTSDPAGP